MNEVQNIRQSLNNLQLRRRIQIQLVGEYVGIRVLSLSLAAGASVKSPNGVGAAVTFVTAGPGVGGYVGILVSPSVDGLLDGDSPTNVVGGFVGIFGKGCAADG